MTTQTVLDYSRLSPDEVIQAVESTGRLSDARVFALNSYENRVYQVGIEDELPLVAKFYRPERWSDAQILEEHAFTRALADAELPVIAPIADANGESLFSFDGYRFALFQRKGGPAPESGDLDQLHRIGMLLGRMHAIAAKAPFTHRPTLTLARYLETPVASVLPFLPSSVRERYIAITNTLKQKIIASGVFDLPQIRTQGDCHLGNILWTRDDGPWLLDFDDCQMAPAVQDLWLLLGGTRQEQSLQLSELLDGYNMFFDFNNQELGAIESLRALRMIHYAGWLAHRWDDPAFPQHFPWFNTESYWMSHVVDLERQSQQMDEPPLSAY